MNVFAGILRIEDTNQYLTAAIQDNVDMNALLARILRQLQTERDQLLNLFVDGTTVRYTERVRNGGVDEGQDIGEDGRPMETHVGGYVDVAYPILRRGWAYGWNEETYAYMTVADLDRETEAKFNGNARYHTRQIFRSLMLKDQWTFIDRQHGSLAIKPLANGDADVYPPVGYSDAGATDNHYITSGYVSGSMSATNNPFVTLVAEIREHFASDTRIVAFVNSAQRADILTKLTNFEDTGVEGITPAPADAQANDPGLNVPGDFLGVDGDSGVYVYVYDRVPATYIVAGAVDEPRPLRRRIPLAPDLQGFAVRAEELSFPFYKRTWVERFGYAVVNRLGWACMELTADGTYDNPATI